VSKEVLIGHACTTNIYVYLYPSALLLKEAMSVWQTGVTHIMH